MGNKEKVLIVVPKVVFLATFGTIIKYRNLVSLDCDTFIYGGFYNLALSYREAILCKNLPWLADRSRCTYG